MVDAVEAFTEVHRSILEDDDEMPERDVLVDDWEGNEDFWAALSMKAGLPGHVIDKVVEAIKSTIVLQCIECGHGKCPRGCFCEACP